MAPAPRCAWPGRSNRYPYPVAFGALNPWYFIDAPHAMRPRLDAARRVADFTEVVGGLDADTALYEARRCMSCGNCFGCDNCFGVCPDNAVLKITGANGYAIDCDYCKGCGLCAAECPSGVILMPRSSHGSISGSRSARWRETR